MHSYSVRAGTNRLTYALDDLSLQCSSAKRSGSVLTVRLDDPGIRVREVRKFNRFFLSGVALVAVALWTVGLITFKQGFAAVTSLGFVAYIHLVFFVVGVGLIGRYFRKLPVTLVVSENGGVAVWSELGRLAEYKEFTAGIYEKMERKDA